MILLTKSKAVMTEDAFNVAREKSVTRYVVNSPTDAFFFSKGDNFVVWRCYSDGFISIYLEEENEFKENKRSFTAGHFKDEIEQEMLKA